MLSAHIRRLDMCLRIPTGPSAFVQRLSANIDANYTITGVVLRAGVRSTKDWFSVLNAVRRNSDLVTGATLFATATLCDKFNAIALEVVSQHPALVREFAEVLSTSEAEGSSMIRNALLVIQGIHDFMRVAGVVKERVMCQPRADGSMQLDELDSDSWRHVRQYLLLQDIKDSD
ncbi:uncharacterized protein LOC144100336 [Amblyomma americanum]